MRKIVEKLVRLQIKAFTLVETLLTLMIVSFIYLLIGIDQDELSAGGRKKYFLQSLNTSIKKARK